MGEVGSRSASRGGVRLSSVLDLADVRGDRSAQEPHCARRAGVDLQRPEVLPRLPRRGGVPAAAAEDQLRAFLSELPPARPAVGNPDHDRGGNGLADRRMVLAGDDGLPAVAKDTACSPNTAFHEERPGTRTISTPSRFVDSKFDSRPGLPLLLSARRKRSTAACTTARSRRSWRPRAIR